MVRNKLLNIIIVSLFFIWQTAPSYAWNSHKSDDHNSGYSQSWQQYKVDNQIKIPPQQSWLFSVVQSVGNFFSTVGSAISTVWDFTKNIGSSIKDFFVKTPEVSQAEIADSLDAQVESALPEIETLESENKIEVVLEKMDSETEVVEIANKQETTQELPETKQSQVQIEDIKVEQFVEIVEQKTADVAQGKAAEITPQKIDAVKAQQVIPAINQKIDVTPTKQNIQNQDMVNAKHIDLGQTVKLQDVRLKTSSAIDNIQSVTSAVYKNTHVVAGVSIGLVSQHAKSMLNGVVKQAPNWSKGIAKYKGMTNAAKVGGYALEGLEYVNIGLMRYNNEIDNSQAVAATTIHTFGATGRIASAIAGGQVGAAFLSPGSLPGLIVGGLIGAGVGWVLFDNLENKAMESWGIER